MPESGSTPTAELAAALSKRYHIERELGRGGMGVVYASLRSQAPFGAAPTPRRSAVQRGARDDDSFITIVG